MFLITGRGVGYQCNALASPCRADQAGAEELATGGRPPMGTQNIMRNKTSFNETGLRGRAGRRKTLAKIDDMEVQSGNGCYWIEDLWLEVCCQTFGCVDHSGGGK